MNYQQAVGIAACVNFVISGSWWKKTAVCKLILLQFCKFCKPTHFNQKRYYTFITELLIPRDPKALKSKKKATKKTL